MATIALPQGATKALSTPKGKIYALGGAAAGILAVVLLFGGGGETKAPAKPATPGVTAAPAATTAPATPVDTAPFAVSPRNPFTKGDGSLPATGS